ncbi:unnamed protein product [Trifolium pratense]|uniref:Uncharacterized protein n=1 Tax=Trifolium pratense TaxID=57577 RepID=A0ACB0M2J1_TRIPR|nr:unnamed protein product [Trifolium pratense]
MISFRFGSGFDKTHPVVDFELSLYCSLQMYTAVKTFVASRLLEWIMLLKSKGVTRLTIKMGIEIPNDNNVDLHNLIPQTPLTSLGYKQLSDLKLHGLCFPNLNFWRFNFLLLQNLSIC